VLRVGGDGERTDWTEARRGRRVSQTYEEAGLSMVIFLECEMRSCPGIRCLCIVGEVRTTSLNGAIQRDRLNCLFRHTITTSFIQLAFNSKLKKNRRSGRTYVPIPWSTTTDLVGIESLRWICMSDSDYWREVIRRPSVSLIFELNATVINDCC